MKKDTITALVRLLAVLILCWCFYWGIIYGPMVWGQAVTTSLTAAPINIVGLILVPFILIFSRRISQFIAGHLGLWKPEPEKPRPWAAVSSEHKDHGKTQKAHKNDHVSSRQPRGPGGRFVKAGGAPVVPSGETDPPSPSGMAAGAGLKPWDRSVKVKSPGWRLQIPGFRTMKRILAAVLMAGYFLVGEMSLTMPSSQWAGVVLILTSFLLCDYLWKTRRKALGPQDVD